MAIPHNTDTQQRVINCSFAKAAARILSALAPDGIHSRAIAPLGYYVLFILNTLGVSSGGKFFPFALTSLALVVARPELHALRIDEMPIEFETNRCSLVKLASPKNSTKSVEATFNSQVQPNRRH